MLYNYVCSNISKNIDKLFLRIKNKPQFSVFRRSIEDGRFIYGKESIEMQPWQIVDFEGCMYYAFLPSAQVSKLKNQEMNQQESTVAQDGSGSIEENDDEGLENATETYMETGIENEPEDTDAVIKNEIESEADNEIENEIDEEIQNELAEADDEIVYEIENNSLKYEEVVIIQGEEEVKNDVEVDQQIYSTDLCNVKIKSEELSTDDVPKDVTILYNQGVKLYVCLKCDFCFTSLEEYKKHMNSVHEQSPRFRCKICYKVCQNFASFKVHVESQHKEGVEMQNLDTMTYNCTFCTYKSTNKSTLHSHISRKHSRRKDAKLITKKINSGQSDLACDICDFKCPNKRRLKEHIERKHALEYKYECDECGKKFKVKGDMRLHVRFKHKEGPIVCDVCGKTCSNSNSLYVHQKWAHFKPKFECEICKRRMVTQENLDQHILLQHERRESFVCEECGKSFTENHRLRQHMMTHTGDRPFDCHVCGKAFARRTSFRQHLLIHTGKRPYICDICGKAFTQKPGLICHRKSHPGVHPPLPVVHIEHIINDFMKKE